MAGERKKTLATLKATWLITAILLVGLFCHSSPAHAQRKPSLEYQVKAAFLFNFTRFIHWPPSSYASADAPFIIGIAGNDPFGTYIDDLVNGEEVDGHKIVIRRYPDGSNFTGCQLLFVAENDPDKLKEILRSTTGQNTLTVGEADNFCIAGGIIRFFNDNDRIKMEIRLAPAKKAQLDISAKLLKVARVN